MVEEKVAPKMGRPRKELNPDSFEVLCRIHCTEQEIADVFQMSTDTLETRIAEIYEQSFSEVYDRFKSEGKMSLRRIQWKMAESNVSMAIWLGKQLLGQRDEAMIDQSQHTHIVLVRSDGEKVKCTEDRRLYPIAG